MTDIAISPCLPADLTDLRDIAIEAYNDHYTYLWNDGGEWYLNRSFSEEALRKDMANPNSAYFMVQYQDEPVGFMKLNKDKALEGYTDAECLELERLYLVDRASGMGIGKWAVDFAVQYALESNKSIIWLRAMDSSRSVDFYEQNGFVRWGTDELDYEQMKEIYRGMVIMKRDIA
ncbi:GNAT family N-acetyltransferase [Pontibacter ramchanderi]|uniref:Acetyltransferase (GNAT) family protein n=1 Tax=Pontibacter ramchanderi TaxID=1179743 RepID=A0A2N3U8R4_9BACT|nr:GNAT family N-acetyltransferase [Pontibacter ramchanderi]PKV63137.1 acetyltransferase (GNAT) family protein [Pontibacter ramchanderi]